METTAGYLDLLASVKGLGTFEAIDALAEKSAAGRPKDTADIIELEAIREARRSVRE